MSNPYASIYGESQATKQARENRNGMFQSFLDTRRKAAEQQRTDDVKMAKYNALGNVLTSMVQPLGWHAGGGSTGGVQPYDNRQYLEAFNRAVKASDNLRNIGLAEDEYKFKIADEDYRRMLALDDEARRRQQKLEDEEIRRQKNNEDYFARLDRQNEIAKTGSMDDLYQARRTAAVKAYHELMRSNSIHKTGLPSFADFINMGGYGSGYYGDWSPTDAEIMESGGVATPAPATATAPATRSTQATRRTGTGNRPASQTQTVAEAPKPTEGLTQEEQNIVSVYSKYDTNGDGVIDNKERRVLNSNRRGMGITRRDARNISAALTKNKDLKGSVVAPATGGLSARSIMNQ